MRDLAAPSERGPNVSAANTESFAMTQSPLLGPNMQQLNMQGYQ